MDMTAKHLCSNCFTTVQLAQIQPAVFVQVGISFCLR